MRILITVKPLMYRESLALALHRYRPDFEVMLAPTASLDGPLADDSRRPTTLFLRDLVYSLWPRLPVGWPTTNPIVGPSGYSE